MKAKIKIKAISYGKPVTLYITVNTPEFHIIPSEEFLGVKLPPVSIDAQIDEWFTGQDKKYLLDKYSLDCIADWEVYHPKKRRKKAPESEVFLCYLKQIFNKYPELERPVSAVMSELKETIFNKGLSNSEKFSIIMRTVKCTVLGAEGAYVQINQMLDNVFGPKNSKDENNIEYISCLKNEMLQ